MKDGAKGIGAVLLMILIFIYETISMVMPLNAVIGHFCSSFVTWLCMFLFFIAYQIIPFVPDVIIVIMYIIGIPYVWSDFPRFYFVIYIIVMISVYIRTIPVFIANVRLSFANKRIVKYKKSLRDIIENPKDELVNMDEFDTDNDDDDYDYYR